MSGKKKPKRPTENQKTAAWADIAQMNEASCVSYPNIAQAMEAKEYVEENQK
jgi:hypothetical protein